MTRIFLHGLLSHGWRLQRKGGTSYGNHCLYPQHNLMLWFTGILPLHSQLLCSEAFLDSWRRDVAHLLLLLFSSPKGPSTTVLWTFEAKKSAELYEITAFGRRPKISFVAAKWYPKLMILGSFVLHTFKIVCYHGIGILSIMRMHCFRKRALVLSLSSAQIL